MVKLYEEPRGSPANVGSSLSAVHPVVRTNPVTGWKSIFAFGPFSRRINELELQESDELLEKFGQMIVENHDLQVRFKWRNKNDIGECIPCGKSHADTRTNTSQQSGEILFKFCACLQTHRTWPCSTCILLQSHFYLHPKKHVMEY